MVSSRSVVENTEGRITREFRLQGEREALFSHYETGAMPPAAAAGPVRALAGPHDARDEGCLGHGSGCHGVPQIVDPTVPHQLFRAGRVLHAGLSGPVRRARSLVLSGSVVFPARHFAGYGGGVGARGSSRLFRRGTGNGAARTGQRPPASVSPGGSVAARGLRWTLSLHRGGAAAAAGATGRPAGARAAGGFHGRSILGGTGLVLQPAQRAATPALCGLGERSS